MEDQDDKTDSYQQISGLKEFEIQLKSSENPNCTGQNEEKGHPRDNSLPSSSKFTSNNKNKNEEHETKTYKKRKGTDDHGKEYEFLICAYYALKLGFDQKVTNFEITTNNEIYLDLDDVALKVTFLDGSSHTFLIQLKHTEQEKGITDSMLSSKKGDFGLLKYFESFQKLQARDNTSCILFTNRKSQLKVKSEFKLENQNIIVNKGQSDNNKQLLLMIDTVDDDEATHIFNFEQIVKNSQDFEDFFKCFYFFTNQKSCRNIRSHIDKLLNEKFGCQVEFINFMRQWWKGTFVLTKHDVIVKLAELVLSPFVQEIPRNLTKKSLPTSTKTKLLKSAIMQFELTLVKEYDANTIAKIWTEESDDDDLGKISKVALKYGLTTKGLQDKDDLASEELTKVLWYLSKTPLIVKYDTRKQERIRAAVELLGTETTRKKLILVGTKSEETFPKFPNWKTFDSLYDLRNETLYKNIIGTFKISLHKRPSISLEAFIDSDTEISKCINIKELFLMLEEDLRIGKPLTKLPVHYIPRTLTRDTISVKEADAISVFDNPVNFVIGLPGIGKSTLMTYLSHHCPLKYWCIRINLIKCITFLSIEHTPEDILDEFLKDEDAFFKKLKATLRKYKRIYLLLDGLDEINEYAETVLKFAENVSSTGIRVWISSREHLENRISMYCEISPIMIQELTRRNQEEYIKKRLCDKYTEEEAKRIIDELFTSVDVTYNAKNVLGVPLLLFIITEIFREDRIIKEDIFVLSKMYRKFFQIKEKHQYKNTQKKHRSMSIYLDKILELYEFSALEASAPQFLRELEIDSRRASENQKFLNQIRNGGDPLEIISHVVGEDGKLRAIFAHQSFAEYFACVWLKKNQEKLGLIKDFFLKRYNENLRLIFDIMLAEDHPLHLAVLYKNLDRVEKLFNKHQHEKDEGGRTALHLICSYCEKNSVYLEASLREDEERVFIDFKILQSLSQSCDPFEKDVLFNWDSFDYALSRNSLLVFEVILEKVDEKSIILKNLIKQFRGLKGLIECCCFRGYCHLFKTLIQKHQEDVKEFKNLMYLVIRGSKDVTEVSFTEKYLEIVKILIDCAYDIHKTLDSENTIYNTLELSCECGSYTMVEILLEHGGNVNNQTLLHLALTNGNTDLIELLLKKGCQVNATDQNQWTLLHHACYYGRYNACKTILELGSGLDVLTNKKQTPLHLALESGKSAIIELLLKKGCNVNIAKENNWTPLHYACHFGTCNNVVKILEHGGDLNAVTDKKQTMLHLALENGNDDIIELLLKKGCSVNLANENEWTPLHYACCLGKFKIVEAMLGLGGDLNAVTSKKQTSLHLAAENGNIDIIELLLKKGCVVNVTDENGWTPLHYACRYGKFDAVTTILDTGAEVNVIPNEKITSLHLAAESGNCEIIELLLKKGCFVNVVDEKQWTPLHYACRFGTYNAVSKILELGGDMTLVTDKKQTSLHLASENGKIDIIELLLKKGCKINMTDENNFTPLHYACSNMNVNAVKTILERGGDVNAVTDKGQTPLHLAIEAGKTSIIQLLLKKGLNVSLINGNRLIPLHYPRSYGKFDAEIKILQDDTLTPLHLASINGNTNVIELLSKKGHDINLTDDNKWSPLHYACRYGTYDAVIKILELGGDLNAVTDKKQTMLHLASMNKSFDRKNIVNYLINNGMNMNATDENGWTCLKYACDKGNYDIIEVLLGNGACLDTESRSILIQNVYGLLREGKVQLIDLLLQLTKIEEIDASLTLVPLEFPIYLIKRHGVLQGALLLKMVNLISKYYKENTFAKDLRDLTEFLVENFDSVDT